MVIPGLPTLRHAWTMAKAAIGAAACRRGLHRWQPWDGHATDICIRCETLRETTWEWCGVCGADHKYHRIKPRADCD